MTVKTLARVDDTVVQANDASALKAAADGACARIAPLWPLKHFVAVNPFLGVTDKSFSAASAWLQRVARTDMLMPHDFFVNMIRSGQIISEDLTVAIATAPKVAGIHDLEAFRAAMTTTPAPPATQAAVATVAEILDRLADGDRYASRTAFMIEEISKWCAAYFDEGQAAWKSPLRSTQPYAAWRQAMRHDINPETMGIRNFRKSIATLPEDPLDTIGVIVEALGIPTRAHEDYLFRALFDIQGWAAYARYRVWDNALYGREDGTLVELLAIRVAWGYALFQERSDPAFRSAWAAAMADASQMPHDDVPNSGDLLGIRVLLQHAYEHGYQRKLIAGLKRHSPAHKPARPALQAAFCIDVRSEVYRRALELVSGEIQTIGFAGFFGFPIEYVPIGNARGGAQCPVLLKPSVVVCESVSGAAAYDEAQILNARRLRRRASKAWKAFKQSAVSSFTYVETMGLSFAAKIAGDSLGWSRPVPDPNRDGLDHSAASRLGPRIEPRVVDGRETGFAPEARIAMAETVLRAMSVTDNFARLVLLTGHGSTTVNNPHASGLDCGACGGHTGEANARVAAAILNDPHVRLGLVSRGIVIPDDTWFLGCLHDTTTDNVRIFDESNVPATHAPDLRRLQTWLDCASAQARLERSTRLGIEVTEDVDARIATRSRDWSQVRPEWGLAGNAAFIAAPRWRTAGVDLGGRAFLHTYDWRKDDSFGVLELIMTAPMVVASWINLQYYGSSVNNRAFGSGNKTLHNVVGALGVLEGNGGDLRPGLPWQSVHDGRKLVHEPLRLSVFIEAPLDAINAVIANHESVRQLVENRWLHLFAFDADGRLYRYWGDKAWSSEALPARAS
ncbi:MAG: DUF2309 domain-containing protein [Alphaproteobacteria bacterium]